MVTDTPETQIPIPTRIRPAREWGDFPQNSRTPAYFGPLPVPHPFTMSMAKRWINRSAIQRDTGLHIATIVRVFTGDRRPSMNVAKKIADSMEITLDELFNILNTIVPGNLEKPLYQPLDGTEWEDLKQQTHGAPTYANEGEFINNQWTKGKPAA